MQVNFKQQNLRRKKNVRNQTIISITEIKRWNFFDQSVQLNGCKWDLFFKKRQKKNHWKKRVYIFWVSSIIHFIWCASQIYSISYAYIVASGTTKNEIPKNSNQFSIHKIYFFDSFLSVFRHRHRHRCCCYRYRNERRPTNEKKNCVLWMKIHWNNDCGTKTLKITN